MQQSRILQREFWVLKVQPIDVFSLHKKGRSLKHRQQALLYGRPIIQSISFCYLKIFMSPKCHACCWTWHIRRRAELYASNRKSSLLQKPYCIGLNDNLSMASTALHTGFGSLADFTQTLESFLSTRYGLVLQPENLFAMRLGLTKVNSRLAQCMLLSSEAFCRWHFLPAFYEALPWPCTKGRTFFVTPASGDICHIAYKEVNNVAQFPTVVASNSTQ